MTRWEFGLWLAGFWLFGYAARAIVGARAEHNIKSRSAAPAREGE